MVYFFWFGVLFSIENANFWPISGNLDYFVANLRTLGCIFYRLKKNGSVTKSTNIRYIFGLFDISSWIPTRAACRSRDASLSKTSVALSQQENFLAKMFWLDLFRPKFLKFLRRVQIILKYVPHVHPKSNLGGFWMKFFKGGAIWNMIYLPSRLLQ